VTVTRIFDTLLGRMALAADARGVVRVVLPGDADALADIGSPLSADAAPDANAVAEQAARELAEYSAGRRRAFSVPVRLDGLTPFRQAVARALRRVPFGRTVTYGELARRAGRPGAARAVGGAMASNPVPILVPCHRVVAVNGLGGFGGGLALKRRLLEMEGVEAPS
jgi:methylated-DNA-[protein]-cysteine S-methyltransferase